MFCSNCGKSLEPAARFCPSCGAVRNSASTVPPPAGGMAFRTSGQLVRSRASRMIAGVCAGFAEHYGWDLNLVRILTVVVTLFTGVALFAYIAAWIIIPEGQYALPRPFDPPPPSSAPAPFTSESSST